MLLHAWRIEPVTGMPSPHHCQKNFVPILCQLHVSRATPRCPRISSKGLSTTVYELHYPSLAEPEPEPEPDWTEDELALEISRRVVSFQRPSYPKDGTCTIHLVGATHRAPATRGLVRAVISQQKPQLVFVELCSRRTNVLKLPSSEFYVAKQEAMKCGAEFKLGDRQCHITEERMDRQVSCKELNSFLYEMRLKRDALRQMSLKDMEVIKEQLNQKCPNMMRVILHERDKYMAFKLKEYAQIYTSIVAVVGAFHVAGMRYRLEPW